MNAIWIGLLIFVPVSIIVFTLAVCRSAAMADGRLENNNPMAGSSDRSEGTVSFNVSPDTKPSARLGHSGVHS